MVYENQTKLMQFEYERKLLDEISEENNQSKTAGSKQSIDSTQSAQKKDRFVSDLDPMEKEQQLLKFILRKLNLLKDIRKMRVVESEWLKDLVYQKKKCEFTKQREMFLKLQKFIDPILE